MAKLPLLLLMWCVSLNLIIEHNNGVHSLEERMMLYHVQRFRRQPHSQQQGGIQACILPDSRRKNAAIILEMKEQEKCPPSLEEMKIDYWKKRMILDDLRVRSMQNMFERMTSLSSSNQNLLLEASIKSQIPLNLGQNFDILNYVVTLELGNQKRTMIVDTGSDISWVQCEPCKSCYNQKESLFKPSTSPSYQSVPCNSKPCRSLQFANQRMCKSPTTCDYVVNYGDGSISIGELGSENLTLGDMSLNNIVFGCGRENKGMFGYTSGVLGLGRGSLSLVSQGSDNFGGVFSYCLPSPMGGETSGSLVFGDEPSAFKNLTPIAYTNMLQNPLLPNHYMLNLIGIEVGEVGFRIVDGRQVIIDSGTVITRLPPSIYNALKGGFLRQFQGYPQVPGVAILDTCFDLTGIQQVKVPTIRMYFEGDNLAKLNVDPSGTLIMIDEGDAASKSKVCLPFASLSHEHEVPIIGNLQQRNNRVIYDSKLSRVGFAKEECTFSGLVS
ncbi:hypothetical protein HN51_053213 [Arachis hypogaea]|uniref:Aspartic proteinase nepenthesin n=1 Tax=Arachis hypogaea TaxID=3818 RepID=A0A444XBL8_ARAHY|nr:aspartyl protease family protein At5g10770-like [Arachis ipaensis]XP_025675774.1 aspartyl protease family protein At5g10770 [Arachis hypogaea]QHN75508.1 aspartic proteinase nepenthesin [Arachis hypogaea]RYQ87101.1 hypothetical protein Ahy_B09g094577 [Arachis hypogaea]